MDTRVKYVQEDTTLSSNVLFAGRPFGEIHAGSTCSMPVNYRFAGMEFDSETGFYHTWFRAYDPSEGRWLSVDPLPGSPDTPQSLNRYVYVLNDPVNLIDPLGLDATCTYGEDGILRCRSDVGARDPGIGRLPGGRCIDIYIDGGYAGTMCPGPQYWGWDFPDWREERLERLLERLGDLGLGLRAPGQTFGQCMAVNANTFSLGGSAELAINVATGTSTSYSDYTSPVTGNQINTFFFGSTPEAAGTAAADAPSGIA